MNTPLAKLKRIAILLAGISAASISTAARADWSIIGLGTSNGSLNWVSGGFNDSGQVVGRVSGSSNAFITGPNGIGMTDLGTLGGDSSWGADINDSGQVVGYSQIANGNSHAFITGPNGIGMTDLGTLGGISSFATGINDSEQVVGYSERYSVNANGYYSYYTRAFITGPDGAGVTDLGTLGGSSSFASAINDSGQVVGGSHIANGDYHAFITGPDGVGMTDLGTLGGSYSDAYGINDSGQVVGYSLTASGDYHAFITGLNGAGMTDLGTLGGRESSATAINDSGEVIGGAWTADGDYHAFLFSHGGMTDLSLLDVVVSGGWRSLIVTDINNNGQMVGVGLNNSGQSEAFILSYTPDTVFTPSPIYIPPIPEPGTYAMLLAGLGLVGFMARRRKEASV